MESGLIDPGGRVPSLGPFISRVRGLSPHTVVDFSCHLPISLVISKRKGPQGPDPSSQPHQVAIPSLLYSPTQSQSIHGRKFLLSDAIRIWLPQYCFHVRTSFLLN